MGVISCGKIRYSKLSAKIALMNTMLRDRDEKRYYFCPNCRAYHLTSQELTHANH